MNTGRISSFSERLDQLVKGSSKSASQIASEIGISKQAMSAWQNGLRSPKKPTVAAIANYFGVDVAWLMGYDVDEREMPAVSDGAEKRAHQETDEFIEQYHLLTPDQQVLVVTLMREMRNMP